MTSRCTTPRWVFTGGGSELGCKAVTSAPLTIGNVTVKQYVEGVYNMKHADIGRDGGIVVGCTILYLVLGLLALRFINHKKT